MHRDIKPENFLLKEL